MRQVDKSHYEFESYVDRTRWVSMWHQLDELIRIRPKQVLEIGPGPGLLKVIARQFGINIDTLDFDPQLCPDHVGSAVAIPLPEASFDVVCAFQVLEHLPYPDALRAFVEMVRVSRCHILLSLPDARQVWKYQFYIPKLGEYAFQVNKPRLGKLPEHIFDGEHYWEINKRGHALSDLIKDLSVYAELLKTYQVRDNPYHRFFLFKKFLQ